MPHRNRVVVIDDKVEDGEAIVRRLWQLQIPSFFLHYDEDIVINLDDEKKFDGIRVVFQDIALVSPDFPGHDDYAAALTGINRLIDDENGPWLLVAWSTWGNDPEHESDFAENLYNFLKERLPEGKRPYHYVVLDKQPYVKSGLHDRVKDEADFSAAEIKALTSAVNEVISTSNSIDIVNSWEANVRSSASRVVKQLWDIVEGEDLDTVSKSLESVLYKLTEAQFGKRFNDESDASYALYQILSILHFDKMLHAQKDSFFLSVEGSKVESLGSINTMLHWDSFKYKEYYTPGTVYKWPHSDKVDLGGLCVSEPNLKDFVIDAFVDKDPKKIALVNECEGFNEIVGLVLMDVTPACDYANDKAFWRRFIVGVKVKDAAFDFFYKGRKRKELGGNFLKATPVFYENENENENAWMLVFNSKLIVSIPDKKRYYSQNGSEGDKADISNLQPIGRVREQLLQEFIFWFSSMASRPGIVSLY
ncbi:hypothetical protein Q9247_05845 [Halomonas meridiana]|uniref:hypothetical protein n=1 Tax=Vreelandella aquamarina TaxID=77097 RepID=UPI00273BD23A|nr:hypothetical protein [Halomonas meridiana]MDP4557199.1 hypothetical protein [Halomonas meridiana]